MKSMNNIQEFVLNTLLEREACSIYWKDLNGFYLGYNSYAKKRTERDGYKGVIIGKSDFDIFTRKLADQFHEEDQLVLHRDPKLIYIEDFALFRDLKCSRITIKKPILNFKHQKIGILGMTYDLENLAKTGVTPLTKREIDVITCLYHGLTQEEMAEKLVISIRTIQSHIEHIKIKLDVKTKSDLISTINQSKIQDALRFYFRYIHSCKRAYTHSQIDHISAYL